MRKVNVALERKFKAELKETLKERFPGCVLFDLNPNDIQGVSDMLILYKSTWAMLECKRESTSPHRPNQDYYVEQFNDMSFAAFIFPENKEEVLNALESALKSRG